MSVLHAVDQHWCPDFVYFFPPDITTQLKTQTKSAPGTGKGSSGDTITHLQSPTSTPFKDVFSQVAQQSGGVNTRLASFDPLSAFNVHVRRAQKLALLALSRGIQVQRSVGDKTLEQEYELDQAWIAGLVGAIEVTLTKPSTAALVTLRPDDPRQLVAFRRPSRDSARRAGGSESGLTDVQEEQAKILARAILSAGVKLDKSAAPMAQLKGALLYYQTVDQIPHFERRLIEPVAADLVDLDIDLAAAEQTDPSERDTNLVVNGNADEDATYVYNTLTCEVMDASVPESEFARYVIKFTDGSAAFEGDWEVLRKGFTHTYPVHPTLGMEKEAHFSIAIEIEQMKAEGAIAEPDLEPDSTNVDGKEDLDRILLGLTTTGAGVEADAKRKTSRLLRNTRTRYIIRAFSIASVFSATFAFPRISRDGGGTEQQPSPDDIGAFQVCMCLVRRDYVHVRYKCTTLESTTEMNVLCIVTHWLPSHYPPRVLAPKLGKCAWYVGADV
ncbi:hypothetical protein SARC_00536 [Sphaeroforma arctica JP610]|uniref:Uncharacterized protein n=1 Tax=Sphaeroforma arctica JP610 TaxID=667725 RepID=A0A0L0GEN7_9EUKA|nr:hypothetical protein SARC_00536 [Sphaeroforma arctica JP610]KNC87346.1 hypothetical protein SARC_00536 [Sphaeroforma arctica JP610]|eukprot:XP_014161248.1 hypothetical protein SARC_00536 [Sphaeroforma arctica JP610]